MAISIKGKGKQIARQRRHLRLRKKVTGTPAFLINGEWFSGFQPDVMDQALRNLKT